MSTRVRDRPGIRAQFAISGQLWLLTHQALGWRATLGQLALLAAAPAVRLTRPLVLGAVVATLALMTSTFGTVRPAEVLWPLVLVFLVMLLDDVATVVGVSATERVRTTIAGHVRQRLRAAANRPPVVDHLEDSRFRDHFHVASEGVRGFELGTMAVSLLNNVIQIAQVLAFACIVALFSIPLALLLLCAVLLVRNASQRTVRAGSELAERFTGVLRDAEYLREVADSPGTAKDIRVFGLGDWLRHQFHLQYLTYLRPIWTHNNRTAVRFVGLYILLALVFTGGYALVVDSVLRGRISVGELTTYWLAIGGVRNGLNILASTHEHAAAPLNALREVERSSRSVAVSARPAGPPHRIDAATSGAIRLEGVSYRYPGSNHDVFTGLDLTIEAGTSLAIVGLNGAGKSTLVKLLAVLHRPTAGRITVGGVDLGEVDSRAWRDQLAVLFQEFAHYQLSLRDNVGLGRLELASQPAERERAARDAGVADLIGSLPLGWDTVLSAEYSGGIGLSGGQWQRVALARTLLAVRGGARVVVLDEPTASLDVRAESEFFQRVLGLTTGLTTILISHRFSTVRHADRIVVLRAGAVVESGAHDELLAADGAYARLFRIQAERFRDHAGDVPVVPRVGGAADA